MEELDIGALRARLRAMTRRRIPEGERRAAVLVPLGTLAGVPGVLFTRRSETVGTHKGQVSFPGGMTDPEDVGPEETALRETEEEIGLPRGGIEVLGLFHDVLSITSVPVTPVVGWVGELSLDALTPNPAEIDDVFALSLPELLDPDRRYHRTFERGGHSGRFTVFDAGPHPVWGLTSYILESLLTEGLDIELTEPRADPPRDWP
jgi:nudix motif 8